MNLRVTVESALLGSAAIMGHGVVSKRSLIWTGAVAVPVVFAAGVWAGSGDELLEASAPTSTPTLALAAPSTTAPAGSTTTTDSSEPTTSTTVPKPAPSSTSTTAAAPDSAAPAPLPPGWSSAEVSNVVDGDTIDVLLDGGREERVRLIGTNSPEGGECFAAEATAGLTGLVLGQTVYLEPDVSDRDQFGRLLRYVWTADDRFVNAVSVAEGWAIARDYPPDTARSAELQAAEESARASGSGLWASDACGTAAAADIRILDVEYDAAGNDNFNLNGEWVEITNREDSVVELTDWVLKDESASHRYPFPRDFSLRPGAAVRVFTGCGQDTDDALYWCATGSAVWNNSGDTAFLLDPDGNIVFSYSYG
ncbi:MAG: lamin tail domain-containing protein [Acidimicrobiia bacterium]